MDPPHRTSSNLSLHVPRVEKAMQAPLTTVSTPKSTRISPTLTPDELPQGESGTQSNMTLGGSSVVQAPNSGEMLGQFSFAPAIQTTVVTTTTTTTTKFPPLVMKAPQHLHELDSKLYPLAASPTPRSIRKLCFDVGGRPTYFHEADDTSETLTEVRLASGTCPFYRLVANTILMDNSSKSNERHCKSRAASYDLLLNSRRNSKHQNPSPLRHVSQAHLGKIEHQTWLWARGSGRYRRCQFQKLLNSPVSGESTKGGVSPVKKQCQAF